MCALATGLYYYCIKDCNLLYIKNNLCINYLYIIYTYTVKKIIKKSLLNQIRKKTKTKPSGKQKRTSLKSNKQQLRKGKHPQLNPNIYIKKTS